ncbi:MAG TPA: FAD binding domain-containing protein [Chloroflexia bacterium]|jgi:xanthine dehydrogenase YagS FAD-binding subunit
MDNFSYRRALSHQEALGALQEQDGSKLLAGGTDLIPLMKEGIWSPDRLIDITAIPDCDAVEAREDGLNIGALVPLSTLASHPAIQQSYTALSDACRLAATPQLRNMGTIGGNLLQQTRCWYYRGPYDCWLKGGDVCYARGGENEYHSIFATSPEESRCVSAHPSDPAAALLALDASVTFQTAQGETELPIEELYALPKESRRSFVTLPHEAVLTGIRLPAAATAGISAYDKAMARASWAFALAGVAIYFEKQGGEISRARIALSGVAPIPTRARKVEAQLEGADLANLELDTLAETLVESARPLSHNGYKVKLLRALFKQTLSRILE